MIFTKRFVWRKSRESNPNCTVLETGRLPSSSSCLRLIWWARLDSNQHRFLSHGFTDRLLQPFAYLPGLFGCAHRNRTCCLWDMNPMCKPFHSCAFCVGSERRDRTVDLSRMKALQLPLCYLARVFVFRISRQASCVRCLLRQFAPQEASLLGHHRPGPFLGSAITRSLSGSPRICRVIAKQMLRTQDDFCG